MNVPKLRFTDNGREFPEWLISSLKDISLDYYQGVNTAADKVEYVDGGIPIIQAKHITKEFLDFSDARGLSDFDYQKYKSKYNPKRDDLLISNIGTLGKIVLVDLDLDFVIAWNIFKITLNKNKCNPSYVRDFLKKIAQDGYFDSIKTGNATKFINKSDMLAIEIPLPSLNEQTKIANFLSAVDEKISQLSKKHELLTQYKKGVMQKVFSQELKFKDDDGSEFPEWETIKLSNLGKSFNGLTGKSGNDFGEGKSYITYKQIFDDSKIDVNKFAYVQIGENERQNQVQYGDVFFTTSSEKAEEVGFCSVLLNDVQDVYLNSFCFGYRINSFNTLHPNFARFIFKSRDFRRDVVLLAQGITRFNISKTSFMEIEIKLPSINEQSKIANFLTAIDDKISHAKSQLDLVKEYKQGLLQQMFV